MPATHSTPTRVASMLPTQNPCGHGGAPGQERPGHLAPVEEVGHLHSPLPDPRSQAAASRLDRATSVEFPGEGIGPPGFAWRWPRRRNEVLVRDHLAVGDLRRIGRASTRRPRSRSPHPVVAVPEALKLPQVPDDGFAGRAAEPVGPLAGDTLVAADRCVHRVLLALRQGGDLEPSSLLRSGQGEQLKRSAKASVATTLDRTPMQHTTFVRSVTLCGSLCSWHSR